VRDAGFHLVEGVGGKLPSQNTQLPPPPPKRKEKKEREREREREREGSTCIHVYYFLVQTQNSVIP
jgi:hypothetical protein